MIVVVMVGYKFWKNIIVLVICFIAMVRCLISNLRADGFILGQFEGAFHPDDKGMEAVVILSYGVRARGSHLRKLVSRNHKRNMAEM